MKRIALIGSTGSIGRQAIEVVKEHPEQFEIVAMAAGSSHELFCKQLRDVKPRYAALADEGAAQRIADVPLHTRLYGGRRAALDAARLPEADIVLVAAGGFAGLEYSIAAIEAGKALALANKETLVCGGDIVMPLAAERGVDILPVDSEHSAIWQCLGFDLSAPFSRLIITASGGAFRDIPAEKLKDVTPAMALKHPTWNMGAKITIDSATLLNKGLEVIEAHHLYGAGYDKITAVLHPQSIVHSMVEFKDGATIAQLSYPTMKLPIQLALSYPERLPLQGARLDLSRALCLQFSPLNAENFPCFALAVGSGIAGGTLPCAMNAAGEVAVRAFLNGWIRFTDIPAVIDRVLQAHVRQDVTSYGQLKEADLAARAAANAAVAALRA